jgi:hypothetical protein
MNTIHKVIPWLEELAFASMALGVLGVMFFWIPAAGVCLSTVGLLMGFFGWITAAQYEDRSAFYLMVGTAVSLASLLLNLGLVTHSLTRLL